MAIGQIIDQALSQVVFPARVDYIPMVIPDPEPTRPGGAIPDR